MNISIILNNIQDPRRNHLQKHSLETIIYITLAAVIGGAESWYEIEEFGNTHIDFFKSKIEGLEEIPSHDTFNRVFSIIKPKEFESGFRQWVQELYGTYKGIIAIDGKEMRGAKSEDENGKICPIRMVSAWAVDNGVSLGQEKVGEKSNEIKAIPKLLKILDLEGCIVTIDAIGCQHKIVKEVIENKGDYLIAVKENQQKLHKSLSSWFSEVDIEGFKKRGHGHYPPTRYQYCTQENHGHGRTEKRICRVISYQSYTEKIVHWEGVRSLVCIENTRTDNKTGETTSENHYYITSLPMDAETILNVARKHWGIENNLHWQLDVSFNEDNQKKKKNAAQNISLINKIALARIKQDETKGSMKAKRKRAGWDSSFLAKLIPKSNASALKVGQGNPTKDNMSIDTDSVISGKVFTKQDIASEDTLNAVIRTQSPKSKDFDFEVFIMRGEKTVQIIPFSYPKDDTFDPNGGRKDSCLMADVTFDGNKDLLVYLGQFGNQGVEYWDAYVWNEVKQKFLFVPSFHDIPNPTLNEKEKIIESFSRGSAVDYEFGKWKFEKGVFVQKELLSHPPRESE